MTEVRVLRPPAPLDDDVVDVVIGTHPGCDIVIHDDPYVSPRHCRVRRLVPATRRTGALFTLADLGSTNGTQVLRGRLTVRCTAFVTLLPGDIIRVGRTHLPWTGLAQ